jgi:tetratricopeptide (TPR) repeat protein
MMQQSRMNWFRRHLNWTCVSGYLLMLIMATPWGIITWLAYPAAGQDTLYGMAAIAGGIIMLSAGGWVIKQKGRSLWWLPLAAVFSPIWIGNESKYNKAIADYSGAIKLNPVDAKAYVNRGLAYAGKGKYDKAITDYNRAIYLDPDNIEAYRNRGRVYHTKGDDGRAGADFSKAIELNPDRVTFRHERRKQGRS